ncbi:asparagine synthase-related protein [Terriglobus sp. RCC_193]|uniref:asparagine synthase-related protein n=1 Tax=Terriglobus sp. RCC_193 TaxID=3239218 RepID=UPI00352457E8
MLAGKLFELDVLISDLGLPAETSAAQTVFRAYQAWGNDFADKLYGEFSFTLWDASSRRLILARDAMARLPLFYVMRGKDVIFSTDIEPLFSFEGVTRELDEEVFCAVMSIEPMPGRTLYRGIRSVEGAHTVTIRHGEEPVSRRYWFPLRQEQLHLKDEREYSEALHAHFLRAVELRIPREGLVASHLSSGFDSSGVTALTAQVLARQNRPLVSYTAVPTIPTDACEIVTNRFDNEWPLASQVATMYPNVEHVAIRNDGADWLDAIDSMIIHAGMPPVFIRNSRWFYAIQKDAQSRGIVTLMEGQAGNLTTSYDGGFDLFDLRRRGQWAEFVSALLAKKRNGEKWKSLLRSVWMPGLKASSLINRVRRREIPGLFDLSMMRSELYERIMPHGRKNSVMGGVMEGDRTSGASWRFSILQRLDTGGMYSLYRNGFNIERADPTADRRLVELCLRIPDVKFSPNGRKKKMYRDAMRNDLPVDLLAETRRGLQGSDFLQMFEEASPVWHEELRTQEASEYVGKYLDLPRMRALLEQFQDNVTANRGKADMLYNYTFGGAISMGRLLKTFARQEKI